MKTSPAKKNFFNVKTLAGFSLMELLIVIAIISFIFIPLLLSYNSYRTTQALISSTDQVLNQIKSVHIFAREARSQKEWGIKNTSDLTYVLYSSGASGTEVVQNYALESGVKFSEDFNILFGIGTGETVGDTKVYLEAKNGKKSEIGVSRSGVVEVKKIL